MAGVPVEPSFYADFQGLAALRREAGTRSPDAIKAAAKQFEALFTQMMLKSMRAATPQDSLLGSDQQDFYQDMFDTQLSAQLSTGRGLGLADMLVKQLMQGSDAATTPVSPVFKSTESPAAANWPPASREEFVQALLPAAKQAGARLGVDPATLIAHAALETGWGKSLPAGANGECSFNLFGIKAGAGYEGASVSAVTREFEDGALQSRRAQFRAYASPAECMQDYVALLSGNARYAGALGTGADSAAFATALQRGGYATDPDYARKLGAVAEVARELKLRLDPPLTGGDAA